jgi:DNA-binding NarL/FixJ family response regulator
MAARTDASPLRPIPAPRLVSVRLAVISDDETLAGRARAILERDGLIVSVEASGRDVRAVERFVRRPSLVLVRRAGDRPGLEAALRWTGRRLPDAIAVVLLPATGGAQAGGLLALGADALLREQDADAALGPVVRAAAAGQVSVPAELRHVVRPPDLSHRERQILSLAVAGLTNAQIAQHLVIAESTVKTHLSATFRRLGVHSRREAAAVVLVADEVLRGTAGQP